MGTTFLVLLRRSLLAVAVVVSSGSCPNLRAQSNSPPTSLGAAESSDFQQLLRACVQIQEQVRSAQVTLEQNRQDAATAAARNAEVVSNGLARIQEAITVERAQDWEQRQRWNKLLTVVVGAIGGVGLLTMLMLIYFQSRMSKGLAEMATALPAALGLGTGSAMAGLGSGDESRLRLLAAMDQLDRRIHEFKGAVSQDGDGNPGGPNDSAASAASSDPSAGNEQERIPMLLAQADSLMKSGNPEAALACFDGVLALDPDHTEALVRKGAALERLHKLNEAIECYDRAIALDSSLTTAYLHKGGLCNRLERFKEALQCYENALRTHDQRSS